MYISIYHFVFGYDREKAKEIAKDRTVDDLVANGVVDYVKRVDEAFALDDDPVDVENVLDNLEDNHVFGQLEPLRIPPGEPGEYSFSLDKLEDVDREHGYMVTLTCHVKPGDHLFPDMARENEVTVDEDALKAVLDFVEEDPALDGAPRNGNILQSIAALRADVGQEPILEKVKEAGQ